MPIKRKNKRAVAAGVSAAALLAAIGYAKVLDETVATVNGEPVMMSEYKRNVESTTAQYKRAMPEFFKQDNAQQQIEDKVLDQMIDDLVLTQQAEKSKVKPKERDIDNGVAEIKKRFSTDESGKPVSEVNAEKGFKDELKREGLTFEQFREKIKKQIMVRKFIDDSINPLIKPPAERDVREFYGKIELIVKGNNAPLKNMSEQEAQEANAIADRLKDLVAERVRVRHILFDAGETMSLTDKNKVLKQAQDVKKQLDDGANFAELAKKYSADTESAARGGDLGFIIKGWLPAEFEKKAFSMQVGETSEPVQTKFGYHIIKVEEKRASQQLRFEDVADDLAQYMASRQKQKELLNLVKKLKEKASIQITKPAAPAASAAPAAPKKEEPKAPAAK